MLILYGIQPAEFKLPFTLPDLSLPASAPFIITAEPAGAVDTKRKGLQRLKATAFGAVDSVVKSAADLTEFTVRQFSFRFAAGKKRIIFFPEFLLFFIDFRIVILFKDSFFTKYITEFFVRYFSLIIDNPDILG